MTDQTPGNSDPPMPGETPSRPIWLQGLIGLLLGIGALALIWYVFRQLLI